jgi:hypothetical protein
MWVILGVPNVRTTFEISNGLGALPALYSYHMIEYSSHVCVL